jgi:hypothetical protein
LAKGNPKIFLDANIVIGAGKPPGGPELARAVDLVEAGLVTVLTTDLTMAEVAKKHAQNDFDVLKEICQPHFRNILKAATDVALPALKRSALKKILDDKYRASTKVMFKALGAKVLAVDDVKPSAVLNAYTAGEGFFSGEGKKDQFPDAFAFECLKREASKQEPVIIVSQDGDFVAPAKAEKHISVVKSLPDLFAKLGLKMDAPEISTFLETHNQQLLEAVDKELSDWNLVSDVEDCEIEETNVTEVTIEKLTAFKPVEEGNPILVVGRLAVKGLASYTHPNWDEALYDSEEKILIPFDNVSGETELDLTIDVSMSIALDEQGEPVALGALRFRNHKFIYVKLHPYHPYE